jgi:RHS repeat-associated protein
MTWRTSFYGYDGHNNVRYLTDGNGTVTDTYDYDAFGNLIARTGDTPNKYLYCGEQYDTDLGLYFLRARYMNPDSGRFWTMDVFEGLTSDPSTLHKYLYCADNPINSLDPSGNFTLKETMVAINIGLSIFGIIQGVYLVCTGHPTAGTTEVILSSFWGAGFKLKPGFARWWIAARAVRLSYLKSARQIITVIDDMRKTGKTTKQIAETVVKLRNEAKVAARAIDTTENAAYAAARNLEKYGNEIGPDIEWLLKEHGSYEAIIESATEPNIWYNLFFFCW